MENDELPTAETIATYENISTLLADSKLNLNECMSIIATLDINAAKCVEMTIDEYKCMLDFRLNSYKEYLEIKGEMTSEKTAYGIRAKALAKKIMDECIDQSIPIEIIGGACTGIIMTIAKTNKFSADEFKGKMNVVVDMYKNFIDRVKNDTGT